MQKTDGSKEVLKELAVDTANQGLLLDLQRAINDLVGKREVVVRTLLNVHGVKDGQWSLTPDSSKLVLIEEQAPPPGSNPQA